MPRPSFPPVFVLLGVVASAAACSSDPVHPPAYTGCTDCVSTSRAGGGKADAASGATDAAQAGDAQACGTLSSVGSSCDGCLARNCCTAERACSGDAACRALHACLLECNDGTCASDCRSRYQQGTTLYRALGDCAATFCNAGCLTQLEGGTSCDPAYVAASCSECVTTSCCVEHRACRADVQCAPLLSCVELCKANDRDCVQGCALTSVVGTAYTALAQCLTASCGGICP